MIEILNLEPFIVLQLTHLRNHIVISVNRKDLFFAISNKIKGSKANVSNMETRLYSHD